MRTQGWWLNVAKRNVNLVSASGGPRYEHYCSIWLGDNRTGAAEIAKAQELKALFINDIGDEAQYSFTLTEEWITGKNYEQGAW